MSTLATLAAVTLAVGARKAWTLLVEAGERIDAALEDLLPVEADDPDGDFDAAVAAALSLVDDDLVLWSAELGWVA